MKKIAILGESSLGIALAISISEKGESEAWIWFRDEKSAAKTIKTRINKKHFPGVKIPETVHISPDIKEVIKNADLIINAVPSFGVRDVLMRIAGRKKRLLPPLLGLAKGIDRGSEKISSQLFEDILGKVGVPYLHLAVKGFATEIIDGKPAVGVLASKDSDLAEEIKKILESPKFRVLVSDDVVGVQLSGVLKNVLAIGVGMFDATNKNPKLRKN